MGYLRKHPEAMRSLDPVQFEHLVARLLEEDGWAVEMTLQSRDGGYDMLAVRNAGGIGVQLLVQAKRYRRDRPVGVGVVRELYAVKLRHHATKALLATTSHVSAPAKSEFRDVIPWEIELKEYEDLVSWIGKHRDDAEPTNGADAL
jgi:HJR/Mrr/RecB family endonuclease